MRTEPHLLQYGRSSAVASALERLALPMLDDLEVVSWVAQALRDAVAHRQGVVVFGDKGTGKTAALVTAVEMHRLREEQRRVERPGYTKQQVRLMPMMRPQNRTELIRLLYQDEMGSAPYRWARNSDDLRLGELVESWRDENVTAICFQEADHFSPDALEGCRDIMARAEDLRGGIGVVLVGTRDVYRRLMRTTEWGQRWRKPYEIAGLSDALLPDVYRRMLPAFAQEAERIGEAAWTAFVVRAAAPVVRGSARRVASHVWEYAAAQLEASDPPLLNADEVTFNPDVFVDTLYDIAGSEDAVR